MPKNYRNVYKKYAKSQIRESIQSIVFDENKAREKLIELKEKGLTIRDYINEQHSRYNIKTIKNFTEFKNIYKDAKYKLGISEDILRKRYEEYEYREKLIISGQYQEYRENLFRNNYIKFLEKSNVSRYIIENIKKLSLDEWVELSRTPDSDILSNRQTYLPMMGAYQYEIAGVHTDLGDKVAEIEYQIKEAFRESGLKMRSLVDYNKINRVIPRRYRETAGRNNSTTLLYESFLQMELTGKKIFKDYGQVQVLAFVGSTNYKSKNNTFVKGYVEYRKSRGLK